MHGYRGVDSGCLAVIDVSSLDNYRGEHVNSAIKSIRRTKMMMSPINEDEMWSSCVEKSRKEDSEHGRSSGFVIRVCNTEFCEMY